MSDDQILIQQPPVPTQLLSGQQAELTNLNDTYTSYKPITIPAINLLATDPSIDGNTNYNKLVK